MNSIENQTPIAQTISLPTPAPTRWRLRHNKKLRFKLVVGLGIAAGACPGIATFIALLIIKNFHISLTIMQNIAFLLGGYALLVFGVFLGGLSAHVMFIAKKFYFPEETGK